MKSTYFLPLASSVMLVASACGYAQTPTGTSGDRGMAEHERHGDFDKWDSHKRGYLTSEDVRGDDWLSKNFERCNAAHDGHMRREEFEGCHE
jgi:hypothetical protein